ncbi:hypothetical protein J4H86_06480 [Spiractinospora alimapuensis]|nr:hypothetical protein [Spiractinospora alimapuensis]QVQ53400.1 hypothetical protein J4H86_06480 [Spiractinospora alimapuensis]
MSTARARRLKGEVQIERGHRRPVVILGGRDLGQFVEQPVVELDAQLPAGQGPGYHPVQHGFTGRLAPQLRPVRGRGDDTGQRVRLPRGEVPARRAEAGLRGECLHQGDLGEVAVSLGERVGVLLEMRRVAVFRSHPQEQVGGLFGQVGHWPGKDQRRVQVQCRVDLEEGARVAGDAVGHRCARRLEQFRYRELTPVERADRGLDIVDRPRDGEVGDRRQHRT